MNHEWFDDLHRTRRKGVDSLRENEWERGIWQSTVEKYADPVHFVYELLQNAEDQAATECRFGLLPAGLAFEHNGKGFTREDVKNITGIGNSAKPEQANKIGRFGIGFKSVFVVTDTPKIFSSLEGEKFAFQIDDLVVPRRIPANDDMLVTGLTRFLLPFRPNQSLELNQVIGRKLQDLGPEILLFLSNIRSVKWTTEVGGGRYYVEAESPDSKVLCSERRFQGKVSGLAKEEYLVYSRPVALDGADRPISVKLAFRSKNGQILPEESDQPIHVFFPTEERAGFRFRVHAPFLLTDNRANVKRGVATNRVLVDAAASLLIETLQTLSQSGRMTATVLGNLPIQVSNVLDEHLAELRRPFHEKLKEAFLKDKLIPTDTGFCVTASQARLVRSDELRHLLQPVMLGDLLGFDYPIYWVSTGISADRTRDQYRFLSDIIREVADVAEIDPDAFARRVEQTFLEKQDDAWVMRLYKFLLGQESLWERGNSPLRTKPIIRLESGRHISPFAFDGLSPSVFLPPPRTTTFQVVRSTIAADPNSVKFLKRLGLTEPDVLDETVSKVLPKYRACVELPESQFDAYLEDIVQIGRAITSCAEEKKTALRQRLLDSYFVLAFNAGDEEHVELRRPQEVRHFSATTRDWCAGNPDIWFLHADVLEAKGWTEIESLINSTSRIITDGIVIRTRRPNSADGHVHFEKEWGNHQRGLHGFYPKATIDGLSFALANINEARAKLLWTKLLSNPELIQGTIEYASHQTFDNVHEVKRMFSSVGVACSRAAWLPDANWNYHLPSKLFLSDLPKDFETESIQARNLAEKLEMQFSKVQEVAEQTGLSNAAAAFVLRNIDRIEELAKKEQKPSFPQSPTAIDFDRRQTKVAEEAELATPKSYEIRPRSVRVSEGKTADDKYVYLRALYTNEDGVMVCQCCRREMPFRCRADGEYYFEAVGFLVDLGFELHQNHIALCPVCAAKFQAARYTDDKDLLDNLLGSKSLYTELELAGESVSIRWVDVHMSDLQTAARVLIEKGQ